jgi:hypothetical protein
MHSPVWRFNITREVYFWGHGQSKAKVNAFSTMGESAKLVPNFADRGCHIVSVTDPYGRILDFINRSRYFFFQVAPQLYSRGWVDPVPDPPLLRKSCGAGNRTQNLCICSQELWRAIIIVKCRKCNSIFLICLTLSAALWPWVQVSL